MAEPREIQPSTKTIEERQMTHEEQVASDFLLHLTGARVPLDFGDVEGVDPYTELLRLFDGFDAESPLGKALGWMRQINQESHEQRYIGETRYYPQSWGQMPGLRIVYSPDKKHVDMIPVHTTPDELLDSAEALPHARLRQNKFGVWELVEATWLEGKGRVEPQTYPEFETTNNVWMSRWIQILPHTRPQMSTVD